MLHAGEVPSNSCALHDQRLDPRKNGLVLLGFRWIEVSWRALPIFQDDFQDLSGDWLPSQVALTQLGDEHAFLGAMLRLAKLAMYLRP